MLRPRKALIEAESSQDFLTQMQERLGVNEPTAAAALASWVSSYEPGPLALVRARKADRAETERRIVSSRLLRAHRVMLVLLVGRIAWRVFARSMGSLS